MTTTPPETRSRALLAVTVDTEWWGRAHLVSTTGRSASTAGARPGLDRDVAAIDGLLTTFSDLDVTATFFVVSDDFEADVVRRIADAGHEVASHSCSHAHLGRLSPGEREREIRDSKERLEELTGRVVAGFRAPSWSISWAERDACHAAIADAGYEYSSSVCGYPTSLFGDARFPDRPYLTTAGIMEIPTPLITRRRLPAGGSFFRALPVRVFRRAVEREQPSFVYLHPWESYPGTWSLRPPSFEPAAVGRHLANQAITNWGRRRNPDRIRALLSGLAERRDLRPLREVARAARPDA